jgi:hypothetical protein
MQYLSVAHDQQRVIVGHIDHSTQAGPGLLDDRLHRNSVASVRPPCQNGVLVDIAVGTTTDPMETVTAKSKTDILENDRRPNIRVRATTITMAPADCSMI